MYLVKCGKRPHILLRAAGPQSRLHHRPEYLSPRQYCFLLNARPLQKANYPASARVNLQSWNRHTVLIYNELISTSQSSYLSSSTSLLALAPGGWQAQSPKASTSSIFSAVLPSETVEFSGKSFFISASSTLLISLTFEL